MILNLFHLCLHVILFSINVNSPSPYFEEALPIVSARSPRHFFFILNISLVISIHVWQINRTKQNKIVQATLVFCVSCVKREGLFAQYGKGFLTVRLHGGGRPQVGETTLLSI